MWAAVTSLTLSRITGVGVMRLSGEAATPTATVLASSCAAFATYPSASRAAAASSPDAAALTSAASSPPPSSPFSWPTSLPGGRRLRTAPPMAPPTAPPAGSFTTILVSSPILALFSYAFASEPCFLAKATRACRRTNRVRPTRSFSPKSALRSFITGSRVSVVPPSLVAKSDS